MPVYIDNTNLKSNPSLTLDSTQRFHIPLTHAGPGRANMSDFAFVKNVLAVAPNVAAMVNLFVKLPKKLIGLKNKFKKLCFPYACMYHIKKYHKTC